MEKLIKPLFFSLEKILKSCNYDASAAKNLLFKHFNNPDPKFDGYSFIINYAPLLKLVGNDIETFDYIALAAQRNYFDYKYLGRLGLDINLCTVPVEKLKTNRLLKIGEDYIHFRYEENYGN